MDHLTLLSAWTKLIVYLSLRVERSKTKQSQGVAIASLSLAMTQIFLSTYLLDLDNTNIFEAELDKFTVIQAYE